MALLLGYIYWDVSPVLFKVPGTSVSLGWYGVMWAMAFIVSRQVGYNVFLKEGLYTRNLHNLFLCIAIPAVVGARLGHFLFYDWHSMLRDPLLIVLPPYEGFSSHGGIIGIMLGVWGWCRMNDCPYLPIMDRLAVLACVAGACIRFGNLMNSEIIGIPTTVPWAFIFKRVDLIPRHPAQLYECLGYLVLFFTLLYIWRRYSTRMYPGVLLGSALVFLWVFRFALEFIKENQSTFENNLFFNMGQLLSMPFVVLGLFLLLRGWRKNTGQMP